MSKYIYHQYRKSELWLAFHIGWMTLWSKVMVTSQEKLIRLVVGKCQLYLWQGHLIRNQIDNLVETCGTVTGLNPFPTRLCFVLCQQWKEYSRYMWERRVWQGDRRGRGASRNFASFFFCPRLARTSVAPLPPAHRKPVNLAWSILPLNEDDLIYVHDCSNI